MPKNPLVKKQPKKIDWDGWGLRIEKMGETRPFFADRFYLTAADARQAWEEHKLKPEFRNQAVAKVVRVRIREM